MSGEDIKILIRRYGKTQSALAAMLGESPQNLGSMLEAKDVKSSLIERMSVVLGIPISTIYGESSGSTIGGVKASGRATAVAGNGNTLNGNDANLLALLKEKDRQIANYQNQISELIAILAKSK